MNNLAYVNLKDYHKFFTFILIYSPKIISPIIAHSETYICKTAQVIVQYLQPLCNEYNFIIKNAKEFSKLVKQNKPL